VTSICYRLLRNLGSAALVVALATGCSQPLLARPSTQSPILPPKPQPGAPQEVQKPYYFPNRPITLLVGAPRGARRDIAARLLAPVLERTVGQPVLVANHPGGDGAEAWTQLKQARPDGYTLGQVVSPQFQALALGSQKAAFAVGDFVPLAEQAREPGALFVRSSSPFKTVEELLDAAKAEANRISFSVVQGSAADVLAAAEFQQKAGVKLRVIQYANATDALMAALSGQVDADLGALAAIAPSTRSGQGRLLAILDDTRPKDYPDIPALRERGVDVSVSSSVGYLLPRDTSPDLVELLAWAFYLAISNQEYQDRMAEAGIPVSYRAGNPYGRFLSSEAERVRRLLPLVER